MSFTLPNLLSLLRMGLVPAFIIAVLDGHSSRALWLFLVAGVTDALDGAIARWFNQQSLLGTYLDPIADKLLLTSAYVVLSFPSLNPGPAIPVWVTVLVLARDVLILIVSLEMFLAVGTTVFQVTAVGLVLLSGVFRDAEPAAIVCLYAVGGLTLVSGLHYVVRANRMVGEKTRAAG
jgi:cardiolipin synthase